MTGTALREVRAVDSARDRDSVVGVDGAGPAGAVASGGAGGCLVGVGDAAAEVAVGVVRVGHCAPPTNEGTASCANQTSTIAQAIHFDDSEHYHAWADLHAPDRPAPLDPWAVP
jgi:hypothetical protein